MRHVKFSIERRGADRWLQYMGEALDEVKIEGDLKTKMSEFFHDVAYFLQNVNEDGSRIYGPPVQKK
jgi:truncated hemoglobin YjbI